MKINKVNKYKGTPFGNVQVIIIDPLTMKIDEESWKVLSRYVNPKRCYQR